MGILATDEALRKAAEFGMDLVEIQPNAEPPVCKILDYGKYKFQAQKRASEARKKQKIIEVKEIKLRPNIDSHDYDVKMRAVRKFLDLVTAIKKFMNRFHFNLIIMLIDIRSELYFFYFNDFLLFSSLVSPFLRLIFMFSVI